MTEFLAKYATSELTKELKTTRNLHGAQCILKKWGKNLNFDVSQVSVSNTHFNGLFWAEPEWSFPFLCLPAPADSALWSLTFVVSLNLTCVSQRDLAVWKGQGLQLE